MLGIAVVVATGLTVLAPASPAHADPPCQSGGVYVLWARGSGVGFWTDASQGPPETKAFRDHLFYALNARGIKYSWAELGNLDNRDFDPAHEYPAYAWNDYRYESGVIVGANEFVKHLNDRYAGDGPQNNGSCDDEVVIAAGFSAGAQTIGKALTRTGGDTNWSLTAKAKQHIAFVALYGDPQANTPSCSTPWKRGGNDCNNQGAKGSRDPYVPAGFEYRVGSWCDNGDTICNIPNISDAHTTSYTNYWIWQSAAELAEKAKAKVQEITRPSNISVGSMIFLGTDLLTSGWRMYPNQYVLSRDARFVLALQQDGNLVLYGPGFRPIWWTGTGGRSVDSLIVQPDGNVVLYGTGSQGALWQTGTVGKGNVSLKVQEDGNVVLYQPGAIPVWTSNTVKTTTGGTYMGTDTLTAGKWLKPWQYLKSADGRYVLFMQGDGNLVLWSPGQRVQWSTGTGGRPVVDGLVLQGDGNLVLYAQGPIWYNSKGGSGSNQLKVQGDGNVVTYSNNGATWWTGTAGKI